MTQALFYAALTASTTAPLALAFTLVYQTGGLFHIALAAVFTFAAYGAFLVLPLGIVWAVLAGLSVAVTLGLLIEVGCYNPLRRRGATPGTLLVASLGVYVLAEAVLGAAFGHGLASLRSTSIIPSVEFHGVWGTRPQFAALVLGPSATLAALLILAWTSLGTRVVAVAENGELARSIGIPVERVRIQATVIASMLAGLAGILTAADVDVGPASGFRPLMAAVVASLVGGSTLGGTVLAAVALGIVLHLGVVVLAASYQDAILFGALALALLARPSGLWVAPTSRRGDR